MQSVTISSCKRHALVCEKFQSDLFTMPGAMQGAKPGARPGAMRGAMSGAQGQASQKGASISDSNLEHKENVLGVVLEEGLNLLA